MTVDGDASASGSLPSWDDVMVPNYGTPDLRLVRGEGCTVEDDAGNRYTDLVAGVAVNILGHAHPAIVAAVREQIDRLAHASNLYQHPQALRLAARLRERTPGHKAMFLNSGTEANEAALKAVRRYAHEGGRDDAVVLAFHGSFHGRTMGSLALTGQEKHKKGFGAMLPGVVHVPFNDAAALDAAFEAHDVAGVFVETIQGEGGVHPFQDDVARQLRSRCSNEDALLVVDEVQTGVGRTGTFWSHAQWDLAPDIVTVAKGLGGGLPIGACLVRDDVAAMMGPGTHGCTFGGNAVACAAANAVLDVLEQDHLPTRAGELGAMAKDRLEEAGLAHRGRGLLMGVPVADAKPVLAAMRQEGYLVGQAGSDVVRLAPPLIIPEDLLGGALEALARHAVVPA